VPIVVSWTHRPSLQKVGILENSAEIVELFVNGLFTDDIITAAPFVLERHADGLLARKLASAAPVRLENRELIVARYIDVEQL